MSDSMIFVIGIAMVMGVIIGVVINEIIRTRRRDEGKMEWSNSKTYL